ncbi:unnamed protein product [Albugo candida]|uniref:Temptin Cys/Cys disulfide domain-containing protein n=1 Tax=Albugo candida TaxID=65357 RepID=A0A024GNH8_9STRA|nr:unnamed protein product [Albugo candida]|eukprot:CCI48345.1 unnamed protein product [Albugo candida]
MVMILPQKSTLLSKSAGILAVVLVTIVRYNKTEALPKFVNRIPNGDQIEGTQAAGHENEEGGGPLNSFGKDFRDGGLAWTKRLCELDSDHDGATNGEELGDPCCSGVPEDFFTSELTDGNFLRIILASFFELLENKSLDFKLRDYGIKMRVFMEERCQFFSSFGSNQSVKTEFDPTLVILEEVPPMYSMCRS